MSKHLNILNCLMNSKDYLTTEQIARRAGCERKAVYNSIAELECSGFGIDVIRSRGRGLGNRYKYIGLYGGGAKK